LLSMCLMVVFTRLPLSRNRLTTQEARYPLPPVIRTFDSDGIFSIQKFSMKIILLTLQWLNVLRFPLIIFVI